MANYATHLGVGAVASGLAATMALAAGAIPAAELATLTTAGIIGSILPDIDLERSYPSRMLFGALGILFAFIALFQYYLDYSVLELWAIWLGVYIIVRLGVWRVFHRHAVHRGIFHSVLAGIFFMVLTALIFTYLLGREPLISWLAGAFVLFGYLVHLTLDEIYSVDFEDRLIKRSFGSALKILQYDSPRASLLMAGAVVIVLTFAPPITPLVQVVSSPEISTFMRERMWPEDKWFAPLKPVQPETAAPQTAPPAQDRLGEQAPGASGEQARLSSPAR